MSCFPCFSSQRKKDDDSLPHENLPKSASFDGRKAKVPPPGCTEPKGGNEGDEKANIKSKNFNFRELATATKNFRQECLLAEGGFGRVYRGTLSGTGQVVAVKQLDCNSFGSKEFLAQVAALSLLDHENLVKLIGYCADGDQRLLVYEFMAGGSLADHVLDLQPDKNGLDWTMRIKLALGAAKGLEYLHDCADPPIVYRNMKSSSILLDNDMNPKISDFGLANIAPNNDKFQGYCAPENRGMVGDFTMKSDVYSFGVVLLELLSGRRAIDTTRPKDEQNLVAWAQPKFRDPKLYPQLADPLLANKINDVSLNQLVAIAAMCVQEESSVRPFMGDVVTALSFLLAAPTDVSPQNLPKLLSVASWDLGSCIRRDESGSSGSSSDSEGSSHGGGSKSKKKNRNVSHKPNRKKKKSHERGSSRDSSSDSGEEEHGGEYEHEYERQENEHEEEEGEW